MRFAPRSRARTARVLARSAGATLAEVVVAILLLALAMLALQALTLAAIRAGGIADRNGRSAAAAVAHAERTVAHLSAGHLPDDGVCWLADGTEVSLTVTPTAEPTLVAARIRVLVPVPQGAPDTFGLTLHAYSPPGVSAPASPVPCP